MYSKSACSSDCHYYTIVSPSPTPHPIHPALVKALLFGGGQTCLQIQVLPLSANYLNEEIHYLVQRVTLRIYNITKGTSVAHRLVHSKR